MGNFIYLSGAVGTSDRHLYGDEVLKVFEV